MIHRELAYGYTFCLLAPKDRPVSGRVAETDEIVGPDEEDRTDCLRCLAALKRRSRITNNRGRLKGAYTE